MKMVSAHSAELLMFHNGIVSIKKAKVRYFFYPTTT